MEKKNVKIEVINHHCAGIDIGSRSHFLAVGQELSDVRELGLYANDLDSICLWLAQNGTTSVAMQSTGSYWQNLYVELIRHGFEVVLANGKFTKERIPVSPLDKQKEIADHITYYKHKKLSPSPKR